MASAVCRAGFPARVVLVFVRTSFARCLRLTRTRLRLLGRIAGSRLPARIVFLGSGRLCRNERRYRIAGGKSLLERIVQIAAFLGLALLFLSRCFVRRCPRRPWIFSVATGAGGHGAVLDSCG